ncbi:RNA methyltransferase [Mediterraneibacter butyricigenes]|uniref:RNA methyltransferase n=1 Tax=Mediterraneibacter butyricigenes TaxID=2316025 RepID=A0A391PGI3_9FIRM|nr:16S rRNA (guanine(966)-N(2))-methyltransferase RsmD [Mediterraneibacter butyricigenes]GCA65672.1 RNA methyltransferase [Mediterraneibacter butyricigenes]
MRVIAGSAKRLRLKTVEGMGTRPTTDRIKETLFNMIAHGLADISFLDLFAGSGAIGIEALSRGAKNAVFVEENKKAAACIKENLEFTRLDERAEILQCDVFAALRRMEGQRYFDYVFMDPPYDRQLEKRVLEALKDSSLIDEETLLIVEASLSTDFSYLEDLGYHLIKKKEYKTNMHVFLERAERTKNA